MIDNDGLDELARTVQRGQIDRALREGPSRQPAPVRPSAAIRWGFWAGIGMWLAFFICSFVAYFLLAFFASLFHTLRAGLLPSL